MDMYESLIVLALQIGWLVTRRRQGIAQSHGFVGSIYRHANKMLSLHATTPKHSNILTGDRLRRDEQSRQGCCIRQSCFAHVEQRNIPPWSLAMMPRIVLIGLSCANPHLRLYEGRLVWERQGRDPSLHADR